MTIVNCAIGGSLLLFLGLITQAADGVEHQSSVRTSTSVAQYPDNEDFYDDSSENSSRYLWRESLNDNVGETLRYELNAYLLLSGSSNKVSGLSVLSSGTEENNRNSRFERHWHNSDAVDGYLTFDRFNLKGSVGPLQFAVGRFPVNLSTTYIFTPNDIFAPFRPHHAYREYKPGVDAGRLDLPWGELGQISVLGVAGYNNDSQIGRIGIQKENKFSPEESSSLLRMANTFSGFELSFLLGKFGEYNLAGFTGQGELFEAVGLKVEGHQRKSRKDGFAASEVALAAEYRLTDSLLVQFEEFYHGSGYRTVDQYQKLEDDPHPPLYFLGTNYSALMLQYDLGSLTQLRPIIIGNHTDNSAMIYVAAQHSVSENAEISASLLVPRGKAPGVDYLRSEYGAYPQVVTIDFGMYF